MGGRFSVRLAPGVRVSASSWGLRAHVGPRQARVHVGGGRTGMSTGAGPFTYYTSTGSRSGRRKVGYVQTNGPTPAQAAKEQQAASIRHALDAIASIHRARFPTAQKVRAPLPPVSGYGAVRYLVEFEELNGVGWFDWRGKRAARARARGLADAKIKRLEAEARQAQAAQQVAIDELWNQLHDNNADVVLEALASAFEDNAAPTAAVGVAADTVSLAVLVPDADLIIPDREVGTTPKGNLSLKKMTKTNRATWDRELVAGHVVISAVEAFAVAPGLRRAAVVAFRRTDEQVKPVLAATLTVGDVSTRRRDSVSAWELVAADAIYNAKGRALELSPLDLSDQPEIAALTAAIEASA